MAQQTRNTLKSYFNTGDKPTEAQFADLIDSVLNNRDDGAVMIVAWLENLYGNNRLNKSAIDGADFALNRRGKGDIYSNTFIPGMVNIRPGDFWVYQKSSPVAPEISNPMNEGDWLIALADNIQQPFNYDDHTKWWQLRFPSASDLSNVIDFIALHQGNHYNSDDSVLADAGESITLESRLAMFEAFSKIKWIVDSDDPGTEQHTINSRDCSVVINAPGDYKVRVEVYNNSGTLLGAKEVTDFLLVQDAALYSVRFLVTDYADNPVRYCNITFDGETEQTGSDGRANFANITPGTYSYSVQMDGFNSIGPVDLVVNGNVIDHPIDLVLNPYIQNASITGFTQVGATVTAEYDFIPTGYEGPTQVKWWVEDYLGNEIVAPVTKIRGINEDYNQFLIPEAAAGHIVFAEIKAYDSQTNTNNNMLSSPMLLVDELNLPAYYGYRTEGQTASIDADIITGVTDPSQQDELPKEPAISYPQPVEVPWKTGFPAMDELTRYHRWFAIPQDDTTDVYSHYQNMSNPILTGPYTFDEVLDVDITINGTVYPYKVYLSFQGPNNLAFKNSPFN